jgi:hypothetical protein
MEGVDRLRDYFDGEVRAWRMTSEAFAEVDSMLRDIEREHEGALKTDADSTSYQLGYLAGQAVVMREHNGLKKAVAGREEVELFGVSYVPLPVDRDDVAIRPGDTLETCDGGTPLTCEVKYVAWDGEDWAVEDFLDEAPDFYSNFRDFCHARKATVEGVLTEFAERYLDYEGVPSAGRRGIGEALMDKYAAKLRMAE